MLVTYESDKRLKIQAEILDWKVTEKSAGEVKYHQEESYRKAGFNHLTTDA